jgi:energy-coupling factor transport system ATP-binding protein
MAEELSLTKVSAAAFDVGSGKPSILLDEITYRMTSAEWVFVTGPNGSGKSTFARILAGHASDLQVDGEIRRGFTGTEPIPYVMQRPDDAFVGSTPWEDTVSGLEQWGMDAGRIVGAAERSLDRVGLAELMHRPIESLSGGQKQLAAVAACTAVNPKLLIMDEAGSMLDPESRLLIVKATRSLWEQGTAVVWISQRLEEMMPGDRVAAFNEGNIVYDGNPDGFYDWSGDDRTDSICGRLGYEPPYAAQTALELRSLGYPVGPLPLTPEALAKAVRALGG